MSSRDSVVTREHFQLTLSTKQFAGTAVLSAIAAVLELIQVELPFPLFTRLTLDPVGIPIAMAAILYGPSAGFLACGVAGIAIAARGNPVGASFKFTAEVATVLPLAAVLYALRRGFAKGKGHAWLVISVAWSAAVVSRVAVMTVDNYVFLPFFYGIPVGVVVGILPLIAVFNLIQGVINVVPAYLVVDRLPPDLKPEWMTRPT